jgi:hypothetical protein
MRTSGNADANTDNIDGTGSDPNSDNDRSTSR